MTPNYPYFGLPNYMRYMNPNFRPPSTSKSSFNSKNVADNIHKGTEDSPPLLNLLGINIYFDDVLIVCLLLFLYNENVNDPFLFIVLVLLLLT